MTETETQKETMDTDTQTQKHMHRQNENMDSYEIQKERDTPLGLLGLTDRSFVREDQAI